MNRTDIEWTEFSSNPIRARDLETDKLGWFCTKQSPGCANCYAATLNRRRGNGLDYVPANLSRIRFELNEREIQAIIRRQKPALIFVCDMTDLFHPDIPEEILREVWLTMAISQKHTFQVLTKQPRRMQEFVHSMQYVFAPELWPLPNVWLGVSVENQRYADERIPLLLDTPAALRFLSCEPLLGPLDLRRVSGDLGGSVDLLIDGLGGRYAPAWQGRETIIETWGPLTCSSIDWVIVGGESGHGRPGRKLIERCGNPEHASLSGGEDYWLPKPQALEWVRSIRDQCATAGEPFFFKQWGGPSSKAAGRLLDGRTHSEMPRWPAST